MFFLSVSNVSLPCPFKVLRPLYSLNSLDVEDSAAFKDDKNYYTVYLLNPTLRVEYFNDRGNCGRGGIAYLAFLLHGYSVSFLSAISRMNRHLFYS